MKFCSECGQPLHAVAKPGRRQPVFSCGHCQLQLQHHPKILVASFITCGDRLLWMRRALDPKKDHWAIPAGFMEEGETLQQAAARELFEETNVRINADDLQLYMMGTITFISEVYIAFHAEVDCEDCSPGEESLDTRFFSRDELPWDEVAHPQANNSIVQAYNDIDAGHFGVYHAEMTPEKNLLLPVSE